jgi:hypothetical protein
MKSSKTLLLLLSALAASAPSSALAADFDVANESEFKKIIGPNSTPAKLAGGMRFIEGPVWIPADGGYLVFSDIPANQLKKWTPEGPFFGAGPAGQ